MGRQIGAGAHDQLALDADRPELAAVIHLDPDGTFAAAVPDDAERLRQRQDGHVRARRSGLEECHRAAPSQTAALGQLIDADALLLWPVEVRCGRVAGVEGGLDPVGEERVD